jgi:hypothetical protein
LLGWATSAIVGAIPNPSEVGGTTTILAITEFEIGHSEGGPHMGRVFVKGAPKGFPIITNVGC